MAHFAKIEEGLVVNVIRVANADMLDGEGNESEAVGIAFCQHLVPGDWVQTDINTSGGLHYDPTEITIDGETFLSGETDDGIALRFNYAGIGDTYDSSRDAFIRPKPYNSWTLNESTCQWEAPVTYPDDGKIYEWDEATTNWKEIT